MPLRQGHELKLENITHRFGEVVAVRDVRLSIGGGELMALLGPSGCGKSTLLRIISGFLVQSQGTVLFDGAAVDHLPASRRGVGIVFQNYALFPHMTVAENVAYGLRARRWPKEKIASRVEEMLGLVHMRTFRDRMPRQLSGGQQQRIALVRCLAFDPKILLLDEPFGALDKNLRLDMQIEVKRLQRSYGITTVLVTHDQEEALSMADRIAVMNQGRIEQVARPTDIYDYPSTLFVNQFVGTTNVLMGELESSDTIAAKVRIAEAGILTTQPCPELAAGLRVTISIRPELLRADAVSGGGGLQGMVKAVMPLGPQVVYEVELPGGATLKVSETRQTAAVLRSIGDKVLIAPVSPSACRVFPAN
jgi:putative spermidine/putrescine transport system ATP-binding protein